MQIIFITQTILVAYLTGFVIFKLLFNPLLMAILWPLTLFHLLSMKSAALENVTVLETDDVENLIKQLLENDKNKTPDN